MLSTQRIELMEISLIASMAGCWAASMDFPVAVLPYLVTNIFGLSLFGSQKLSTSRCDSSLTQGVHQLADRTAANYPLHLAMAVRPNSFI